MLASTGSGFILKAEVRTVRQRRSIHRSPIQHETGFAHTRRDVSRPSPTEQNRPPLRSGRRPPVLGADHVRRQAVGSQRLDADVERDAEVDVLQDALGAR